MEYTSVSGLCREAEEQGKTISALVLADQAQQMELTREEVSLKQISDTPP